MIWHTIDLIYYVIFIRHTHTYRENKIRPSNILFVRVPYIFGPMFQAQTYIYICMYIYIYIYMQHEPFFFSKIHVQSLWFPAGNSSESCTTRGEGAWSCVVWASWPHCYLRVRNLRLSCQVVGSVGSNGTLLYPMPPDPQCYVPWADSPRDRLVDSYGVQMSCICIGLLPAIISIRWSLLLPLVLTNFCQWFCVLIPVQWRGWERCTPTSLKNHRSRHSQTFSPQEKHLETSGDHGWIQLTFRFQKLICEGFRSPLVSLTLPVSYSLTT